MFVEVRRFFLMAVTATTAAFGRGGFFRKPDEIGYGEDHQEENQEELVRRVHEKWEPI